MGADRAWSEDSLLPLFDNFESEEECQAAWHGFLRRSQLNPEISELMSDKFLCALHRIDSIFINQERRYDFIRSFAAMSVYFTEDPFDEWIPAFFTHANSAEDRRHFTWSIGVLLGNMDDTFQRRVWDRMLRRYWEGRLHGVPLPPPDAQEIGAILDWLPTLDSVFPEAVGLAIQIGGVSLDNHSLVRRIARAEFAQKYPEATARLLIHLGSMTKEQNRWMWYAEKGLFDDLLQQELPQDVKTDLRELMAELGLT